MWKRWELAKAVDARPHPQESAGANMVGKQRATEASVPGLRRRKVSCLLLCKQIEALMIWQVLPSFRHVCKKLRKTLRYAHIITQNSRIVQVAYVHGEESSRGGWQSLTEAEKQTRSAALAMLDIGYRVYHPHHPPGDVERPVPDRSLAFLLAAIRDLIVVPYFLVMQLPYALYRGRPSVAALRPPGIGCCAGLAGYRGPRLSGR